MKTLKLTGEAFVDIFRTGNKMIITEGISSNYKIINCRMLPHDIIEVTFNDSSEPDPIVNTDFHLTIEKIQ
jgi:hypothetical protein